MAERDLPLSSKPAGAPRELVALMLSALVLALAWAVITPPFQAPDEQSHFAYTQYVAETFSLPGDPTKPIYSTEHAYGAFAVGADTLTREPAARPEWSEAEYRRWRAERAHDRRDDGGGAHSAASYPPLSYLWEAGGYQLAGGTLFDRLTAARIASGLWLPVTVLATWLLAGIAFGRDRLRQTVAAAVPALLPMVAFISGSVSPDGMMYALWSLALWLGARVLRHGLTARDGLALGAVVGLACVTKTTSYALLPALAFVLVVGVWRLPGTRAFRTARAGALLAPLGAILAGWAAIARAADHPIAAQLGTASAGRDTGPVAIASYLWQFYLPRVPGQSHQVTGFPLYDVWIRQTWAAFGWLEVRFAGWVYALCAAVTATVVVAAVVALWRARGRLDRALLGFLALAAAGLLAGLHWTDFHMVVEGMPFMQGRYLFPVISLAGLGAAAALGTVPARRRRDVASGAIAALLIFHLACFGLVLERFYA